MGYVFDALIRRSQQHSFENNANKDSLDGHPILRFHSTDPDDSNHQQSGKADFTANQPSMTELTDDQLRLTRSVDDLMACPTSRQDVGSTVQLVPQRVDERVVAITAATGIMAEEYRSIRAGLLAKWSHKRRLVHTVTSATPQEGKTFTCVNLGLIFGELTNRHTIVVEADLRMPQFKKLLALPDSPGLTGVLKGEASWAEAVVHVKDRNVSFLPAGEKGSRSGQDAAQLLAGPHTATLLAALRREYDHVIIDTPPVVDLADAGIIGAMSDDVLLIVRMNRTSRSMVEQSIRTLATYRAPVAGLIATDQSRASRRYYSYRYGYSYRSNGHGKAIDRAKGVMTAKAA